MQRKLFNYVHSLKPGERLEKLLCGFLVVGVRYWAVDWNAFFVQKVFLVFKQIVIRLLSFS